MKDFYEFLNQGYNFLGFLVFLIIVFGGFREMISAATRSRKCNCPKPSEQAASTKSKRQQLND